MQKTKQPLKSPFPYPGGKSRIADIVWARFGNVANFIEPFMGSAAVLLRRPSDHFRGGYRVETANDANHYICNFWRAVAASPDEVAAHADRPVIETDLHATHKWLVRSAAAAEWRERMCSDPFHYDAKIAGYWVHGACAWIGGAWCSDDTRQITPETKGRPSLHEGGEGGEGGVLANLGGKSHQHAMPLLDPSQKGVHSNRSQRPNMDPSDHGVIGSASKLKMPNIGQPCETGGIGVHGVGGNRPNLADAFDIGRGVNAGGALSTATPSLRGDGGAFGSGVVSSSPGGVCEVRRAWLVDWMRRLSDRLRLVRTCYGHWSRVCDSESTLTRLGTTGVFLDPPYPANRADTGAKSRDANLYATDKGADLDALRDEVLAWCRKWGGDKQIRVALCCYEGDGYEALEQEGWSVEAWSANGGYANQRRKGKKRSENANRERIFWSPHCLEQRAGLFDDITPDTTEAA